MNCGYHHGDLSRELVDVAVELIDREGFASFSIAEACRRLNVSTAAPYRHFTDRTDLLAAIAIRCVEMLAEHVAVSSTICPDPVERLARSVSGYVMFAARHPALFDVVFSGRILIGSNPQMAEAMRPVVESFVVPTYEIPGITDHDATSLVITAGAIAHGYGAFTATGSFDTVDDTGAFVAQVAAEVVQALVRGRDEFLGRLDELPIIVAGKPFQAWVDIVGARLPRMGVDAISE
ncbi:helix-turn-helix domain-containing protein [Mycobacterium sp. 050128]|uniref:TetR/AcrR family transcriptional regulator n=1 Tax=Mycobacterium sp. 050128 TaxID=3096112 RepID=UPI002EDB8061